MSSMLMALLASISVGSARAADPNPGASPANPIPVSVPAPENLPDAAAAPGEKPTDSEDNPEKSLYQSQPVLVPPPGQPAKGAEPAAARTAEGPVLDGSSIPREATFGRPQPAPSPAAIESP